MVYSIGLKYTFFKGDSESQVFINPEHVAYAAYKPAHEIGTDDTKQTVEQTLTLHFAGAEPLELYGAAATEVWKELKKRLPDYMRIPLERT